MTISFGAVGASASGTTSVTPALPAGITAGMLGVLQVVSGHPSDSIPSTPSGWTLAGSFSGGGGTFGAGTGPRRLTFFVREFTASETAPTTTQPAGTGATIAARVYSLSRSAGTGWRWALAFAEDTASGTAFTATSATTLTWSPGDFAVLGYAIPLSTAGLTAEAITATGITFGTITEFADDSITTGNASRFAAATGAVTSGTGTQAPTVAATLSAASTGACGVLRVREATATLTVTAQSVFPPRNLLSLTGMSAGDITSVTINRMALGTATPVRAAVDVNVTGQNAMVRVDGEQPFGVPLTYQAVLTDINGNEWTVTSASITSTVPSDVISDAIRGVGAPCFIEAWPDKKRTREASVFNVGGRYVVVGKPRSTAQSTVTVSTDTNADGDALQSVLQGLTEGVLLIRKQVTDPRVDSYLALLEDTEKPNWQTEYREWDLSVAEGQAWASTLEAAGFSLADIANNFTSLADIAAAFPTTLLSIATFDFGG
ncbi:hypothetical protein ACF1AY_15795 [Streptomyces sp. NPDC014776]|uniref:hypothetical protein n=1 Tax=unclassified Streptomyces TaxID=2593676 RepID=UPI0037007D2D